MKRIDYILIWGHGIKYFEEIRLLIRESPDFNIKKIIFHKPKSINKLVKVIYSYDYAPFEHLKAKTKYLKKTPEEVIFLFIENKNPDVDYLGEGSFRHEESLSLKQLKEKIRDKYNPRKDGKRTENHIIHASDNELQTDYILKYLSFKEGVKIFQSRNKYLSLPYYIDKINKLKIKKIPINALICNIAVGKNRYDCSTTSTNIMNSPHFQGLTKDISIYKEYIDKYIGGVLTEDYYPERLIALSDKLEYLQNDYCNAYIVVKKVNNDYLILDGLHRASVLLSRDMKKIIVGEVIE
ncbi:hypothetical protein YH65_01005 [Sulfurovum lithotrophicum]|uniref:ParB/Sulfiredoxin domain-containing protein n=1 Tax=Sulfurovum lithotrophicum TaxID=206403 RepID=A0A7U4LZN0_9BACT|nr:hypothetical protein [Sulfurovum lithotrophicum]AKF24140.1 hypothetical protein YH65_01005 [Sulfurovum lithotrophicum]